MPTLWSLIEAAAENHDSRPALTDGERTMSWLELAESIQSRSAELASRGVVPGSGVVLALLNRHTFVLDFFAVTALGATAIPLHPGLRADELRRYLCGLPLVGAVVEPENQRVHERAIGDRAWIEPAGESRRPRRPAQASSASSQDQAIIGFSSGSTGRPKRMARTHANLLAEADHFWRTVGPRPDDVILGVAPLFHAHGLANAMLASARSGACLALVPVFGRDRVLEMIHGLGVTIFPGSPPVFQALAARRSPPDTSSLRLCFSAGAPLPLGTFDAFRDRFRTPVRQLYGCSEAGSVTINLDPEPELDPSSVGRPMVGVDIEIRSEAGSPVAPGTTGEIWFRSDALASGYLDASADGHRFRDGWFGTGDLGAVDHDGRLTIRGRTTQYISTGGHKVDPYEVEQAIRAAIPVRDVVVLGLPTGQGDHEVVKAVLVTDEPAELTTVVRALRGRLADFKLPHVVELRNEIPRNALGKVLRKDLLDPAGGTDG